MGDPQEAAVRALMAELEGEEWDSARVERAVSRMAAEARYQVHAGDDPFVGTKRSEPSSSDKPQA